MKIKTSKNKFLLQKTLYSFQVHQKWQKQNIMQRKRTHEFLCARQRKT